MIQSDTICALATAPGVAGIAVIRVSGPAAFDVVDAVVHCSTKISSAASHTIHYGRIKLEKDIRDEVTVALFRAPRSYTGEDVVEISCHGGFTIPDLVLRSLYSVGVRAAGPGEFTRRAFLNGKMDLTQVESVAELIHASSSSSAAVASRQLFGLFRDRVKKLRQDLIDVVALLELELDFAHEDVEFVHREKIEALTREALQFCQSVLGSFQDSSLLRSGLQVALLGLPNAGKSLLFNNLLNIERSIVHDQAGTTRDYIQESVLWDGLRIVFADTAGLRDTEDAVERQGVRLSSAVLSNSELILVVNDAAADPQKGTDLLRDFAELYPEKSFALVQNKMDLVVAADLVAGDASNVNQEKLGDFQVLKVSAKTGSGIAELKDFILSKAKSSTLLSSDILLNQRHVHLLTQAAEACERALVSFSEQAFNEAIAFDLRHAIVHLGDLTGETFNEEVLNSIFSKFCIGK